MEGRGLNTEFINLSEDFDTALNKALEYLSGEDVIGVPTETVYGLGCDLFSDKAIRKIFELKGRNWNKPLTAFCHTIHQVEELCSPIPEEFYILAKEFLPGPLTIIMKKNSKIATQATCGLDTIGIRIPDNFFNLKLMATYKKPLATTSANISSMSALADADSVFDLFSGKIPLVVDGGRSKFGIASTVVDLSGKRPEILRQGVIGRIDIHNALNKKLF